MDLRMRRVVFVTRDGAAGGGQVFLLYLLRWLRQHTDVSCEVLSWYEGPLLEQLGELAPVRVLEELNAWRLARAAEVLGLRRLTGALKSGRLRWWLLKRRSADLLYVNGLEAARILGFVGPGAMRSLVHVHDLAELGSDALSSADRQLIVRRASLFVAGSDEVAAALQADLGVDPARILRHDYFIAAGVDGPLISLVPPTRAELAIRPDDFVVGGTGSVDWWAEPEQFVLMAWALCRRYPEIAFRFLWVAGDPDDRILWPLRHDLESAGLTEHTTIVTGPKPFDFLGAMDVLVLSTRHEPAELLVFEAVGADTAVVCTDNILRDTAAGATAMVVPYLDIDALVEAVGSLASDAARRTELVERGREVAAHHHDVSVGARALFESIGRAR